MEPEYPRGAAADAAARAFLADHSLGIESPEILRIAWEVRRRKAAGERIFDLTLGDFDPRRFPPPEGLVRGVGRELEAGRTNYPPADGIPALRRAISAFYGRRLGLHFPEEAILVGSGARPLLYAVYGSTLEAGDVLVYSAPSWNNEHYGYLNRAREVVLEGRPEADFLPTLADVEPHLSRARVLHLNNPLNPTGTMMEAAELEAIARAVVDENRRRDSEGRKALVLLYDMVYWLLTYGDSVFHHPAALVPEVAPYLVTIDAVSKWMAATGLRVGWAVVPPHAQPKIKALGSHMGAWAPHAEQHAVTAVLEDDVAFDAYLETLRGGLEERLVAVWRGVEALHEAGYPVEAIRPQGAFYLSVRLDLAGKVTPDGRELVDAEAVRDYLLGEGRIGLIPFGAFGSESGECWFRVSVAGLDVEELERAVAALADAVRALR